MKCQVDAIQWGVVAEFFRGLQKPARFSVWGGSTRNFPLMGPFYIFRLSQGGGPGPPLNRPLQYVTDYKLSKSQVCDCSFAMFS